MKHRDVGSRMSVPRVPQSSNRITFWLPNDSRVPWWAFWQVETKALSLVSLRFHLVVQRFETSFEWFGSRTAQPQYCLRRRREGGRSLFSLPKNTLFVCCRFGAEWGWMGDMHSNWTRYACDSDWSHRPTMQGARQYSRDLRESNSCHCMHFAQGHYMWFRRTVFSYCLVRICRDLQYLLCNIIRTLLVLMQRSLDPCHLGFVRMGSIQKFFLRMSKA